MTDFSRKSGQKISRRFHWLRSSPIRSAFAVVLVRRRGRQRLEFAHNLRSCSCGQRIARRFVEQRYNGHFFCCYTLSFACRFTDISVSLVRLHVCVSLIMIINYYIDHHFDSNYVIVNILLSYISFSFSPSLSSPLPHNTLPTLPFPHYPPHKIPFPPAGKKNTFLASSYELTRPVRKRSFPASPPSSIIMADKYSVTSSLERLGAPQNSI